MTDTAGRERRAAARKDTIKQAVAVVRTQTESIANMTPEERTIATPQNQAVWIVRSLEQAGLLTDAASAAAGSICIDEGYLLQAIAAETANLALTQQRLDQINDEWRSLNEQRQNAITQVTRLKARKGIVGQMLDELRAAAESAEASGEETE